MMGSLLWRGLVAGLLAGLLCFAFLKVTGEPQVERAIAFESSQDEAKAQAAVAAGQPGPIEEPELVSRATQAGFGLFTGVLVFGTAFGGLFGLMFALAHGRASRLGPRGTAACLAAAGFVAVSLVPGIIYPANPPSVGDPETIGLRTALFFGVILLSLIAAVAANMLRRLSVARWGTWKAAVVAVGFYIAAMVLASALLPTIDEVPGGFPAAVLWKFRVASLGAHLLMWSTLGLVFGVLAEQVLGTASLRPTRFANGSRAI